MRLTLLPKIIAQGATTQSGDADIVTQKVADLDSIITKEHGMVKELNDIAQSLKLRMDTALTSVRNLNELSNKTATAVNFVSEQTTKTNNSADSIKEAVNLISDITTQTNLLSLNASIEAARAGEQGKGFAVVADEIRKLADMSAESAVDIDDNVKELIDNSDRSIEQVSLAEENLKNQMHVLNETVELFKELQREINTMEEITSGISYQTEKLDEVKITVTDSISDLAAITQENAASTQETSSSIQLLTETVDSCSGRIKNLLELSDQLKTQADQFEL